MTKHIKYALGQKFGKLTLVKDLGSRKIKEKFITFGLYRCDCGNVKEIRNKSVRGGQTKSCGCTTSEFISAAHVKHGKSKTRTYHIWAGMLKRAMRGNHPLYRGRGITCCARWSSFEMFLADMGEPPTILHTIERVDNNGNYEPGNCVWATRKEQAQNTRRVRRDAEGTRIFELASKVGLPTGTVLKRINKGMPLAEALSKPLEELFVLEGVAKTLIRWSETLGIKYATLYNRVKLAGMSLSAALTPELLKTKRKPLQRFGYLGVIYDSAALAEHLGITKRVLFRRINTGVLKATRVK